MMKQKNLLVYGIIIGLFLILWGSNASADSGKFDRFSLGGKVGYFYMPDIAKFTANYSSSANTYSIADNTSVGGFPFARFNFTRNIGIEASYGFEGSDGPYLETWNALLVYTFLNEKTFQSYIKGGLVYGQFEYENLPGDFSGGAGYELGAGFETTVDGNIAFTMDILYRDLSNKYNKASGVSPSTPDKIDLSGFGAMLGFAVRF